MKTIIAAVISIVLLMGAPSVFALSEYQSGFEHGVIDWKDKCSGPNGCHWYILEPGHGFKFLSWEFIKGYVNGWCSIPANNQSGSDADEGSFDCIEGPNSASWYESGGLYPRVYDQWGRLIPTIHPAD